jgi:hypothetical protein
MNRSDAKMLLKKLLPFGLTAILLFTLVLSGCRSGIGNSGGNGGGGNGGGGNGDDGLASEVYVAGFYIDEDGAEIACYWDVNGERYDIDENFEINWLCLSFYDNELRVAGYYSEDGKIKIGYSDATGTYNHQYDLDINDAPYGCNTFCGFVYNGQIYVGGSYSIRNTFWLPCYWESTGRHALSKEEEGGVGSIFVNDNGVYAAGSRKVEEMWQTCYWKNANGEVQVYDIDGAGSRVTQIVVDNSNNVYISGTNSSGAACYWVWDSKEEKATEHQLDGLEANSIFVSNNQVYIGGLYEDHGKALPCYWDSTGWRYDLDLPDNAEGNVGSIFVYNDKVYAAGSYIDAEGGYACYWDPMGIRHDLDVDGSKSSWIKSILVR